MKTYVTIKEGQRLGRVNREVKALQVALEDIKSFVVVQDFYYDVKDNTLKSRVLAVAPVRMVYDDQKKPKYSQKILWIVYDDDFLNKETDGLLIIESSDFN